MLKPTKILSLPNLNSKQCTRTIRKRQSHYYKHGQYLMGVHFKWRAKLFIKHGAALLGISTRKHLRTKSLKKHNPDNTSTLWCSTTRYCILQYSTIQFRLLARLRKSGPQLTQTQLGPRDIASHYMHGRTPLHNVLTRFVSIFFHKSLVGKF